MIVVPSTYLSSRSRGLAKDASSRKMPSSFEPGQRTVICGRGKACTTHAGNRHLKALVHMNLSGYSMASNKMEKSKIVTAIINRIKEGAPEAPFVKFDKGAWWHVEDCYAREKIGCLFREALHSQYRSSTKSKNARKKALELKNFNYESMLNARLFAIRRGSLGGLSTSQDMLCTPNFITQTIAADPHLGCSTYNSSLAPQRSLCGQTATKLLHSTQEQRRSTGMQGNSSKSNFLTPRTPPSMVSLALALEKLIENPIAGGRTENKVSREEAQCISVSSMGDTIPTASVTSYDQCPSPFPCISGCLTASIPEPESSFTPELSKNLIEEACDVILGDDDTGGSSLELEQILQEDSAHSIFDDERFLEEDEEELSSSDSSYAEVPLAEDLMGLFE